MRVLFQLTFLSSVLPLLAPCNRCSHETSHRQQRPKIENRVDLTPKGEILKTVTQTVLRSGLTFNAPKGWIRTQDVFHTRLDSPSGKSSLWMTEMVALDAPQAVNDTFHVLFPQGVWAVERMVALPAPEKPFSQAVQILLSVSSAPAKRVWAQRLQESWFLVIEAGAEDERTVREGEILSLLKSAQAPHHREVNLAHEKALPFDATKQTQLDAFIASALQQSRIPGLSVSVVQGQQVVYEKAYGVRRRGEPAPITLDTPFLLGSTSTVVTSLAMARWMAEKKLDWDTPLEKVDRTFARKSDASIKALTFADAFCACVPMAMADTKLLFEHARYRGEQQRLDVENGKFDRSAPRTFNFSSVLVSVAAHVAAANGQSGLNADVGAWISPVTQALQMQNTFFDWGKHSEFSAAFPHRLSFAMSYEPFALEQEHASLAVLPAAGVWASVRDLSKLLLHELQLAGNEAMSSPDSGLMQLRFEKRTSVQKKTFFGLSYLIEDVAGTHVLAHPGSTLGFSSDFFFLPKHKIGAALLLNGGESNVVRDAIRARILELVFSLPETAERRLAFALKRRAYINKQALQSVELTPDVSKVSFWLKTYASATLGRITLKQDGAKLQLDAGEFVAPLALRKGTKTPQFILVDHALEGLSFQANENNGLPQLVLSLPPERYVFDMYTP